MSSIDKVQSQMSAILFKYGLQTTLKTLIFSLTEMVGQRGHSVEGVMVLESLKGILRGYCGRYEDQHEIIKGQNDDQFLQSSR